MPTTDTNSVEFLQMLRPGGPWVLSAIEPDGEIKTITAKTGDNVRAFVSKHNGIRNLYYSVNPTRKAMTKKAAKTDIAAIEYLPADLDPKPDETPEAAKARFLAALDKLKPEPTAIIDSGNGIQVLLKLAEPIKLPEPVMKTNEKGETERVFPEQTAKQIADVESRVKLLMETLGSVAGTQNIDRILRLPGTMNLPNAKKLSKGRTACPTRLIKFNGATCKVEDLPKATAEPPPGDDSPNPNPSGIDWAKVAEHAGWLKGVGDLPEGFSLKGKTIIAHDGNLSDLNFDLTRASLLPKPYGTWSDVAFGLTAIFKNDGRFSIEQIVAALMCDLGCNRHVTKMKDESAKRRAVERLILRSCVPTPPKQRAEPDWREKYQDGSPRPSMHNARLAITALGIECSYDTFHNKILFDYADDKARHTVESILGEVTDNGIIALRQLMSDQFGFDLEDKATRDAVKSLALEHCFDPVADMLDEAEAKWDGEKRLDGMAVDYFNCKNTPLNRACVRKTMIAAVARVRQPGCKFDTINVLESPEGLNKSTAWRVLAGDENFSDEAIIGKQSREVQEHLATVWIHENAELAGMKKAELETVKAFASRQVDRARPAYGHFLTKQPRHSIEVGTTNSDEYLQSQTGNRRFWGMKVLKSIDLEKLKRDRLLLWGEAAHYQSKGECLTIDEALWPDAALEQEKRRVKDAWEDILADIPELKETQRWDEGQHQYVRSLRRIIHIEDGQERVASETILTHVLKIEEGQQGPQHTMRLSNVMQKLGWERDPDGNKISINGKQVRGYFRPLKPCE